jgi:hypothetical protein
VAFVRLLTTKNPVSDEPMARVWLGNAKWSEMPAWAGVKLSGNAEDAEGDVATNSTEARSPAARRALVLRPRNRRRMVTLHHDRRGPRSTPQPGWPRVPLCAGWELTGR